MDTVARGCSSGSVEEMWTQYVAVLLPEQVVNELAACGEGVASLDDSGPRPNETLPTQPAPHVSPRKGADRVFEALAVRSSRGTPPLHRAT